MRLNLIKLWRSGLAPLLIFSFFVFSLIFFLFHLVFARRIIPGVLVKGVGNLSFLTEAEARSRIVTALAGRENQEVIFDFGLARFTLTPAALGAVYEATATARKAYSLGRSGQLPRDLITEGQSLLKGTVILPVVAFDEAIWDASLEKIYQDLAVRDAAFGYKETLIIEPEKDGLVTTPENLEKVFLESLPKLEPGYKIQLPVKSPEIRAETLSRLYYPVLGLIEKRPSIYLAGKALNLDEADFLKILKVGKEASISVDRAAAEGFVKEVSLKVNAPPRTLSFSLKNGKVVNFSPAQDGIEVAESRLLESLSKELVRGQSSRVEVPIKRIAAPVAGNDYGIREVIGEGVSDFAGSIPGRVKNIKRAAEQINGVLVEPGGTFSFNQSVGDVSAETGYDYAYIIKEGRTVLGPGGGVCQVSTTLFRAVLNSGLPVVQRTAHAYRVRYYEQGSPVGLDATVFAPSVDFQFRNDTPNYILISSQVFGSQLYFKIYGSKDGRRVEMLGPNILSASPAPPPLYQDEASLPKGVIKQVDFAAPGAVVTFQRDVFKEGQILYRDKFTSNYKPWRAIYLVGTGE